KLEKQLVREAASHAEPLVHCLLQSLLLLKRKESVQIMNQNQPLLESHNPLDIIQTRQNLVPVRCVFGRAFDDTDSGIYGQSNPAPGRPRDHQVTAQLQLP